MHQVRPDNGYRVVLQAESDSMCRLWSCKRLAGLLQVTSVKKAETGYTVKLNKSRLHLAEEEGERENLY